MSEQFNGFGQLLRFGLCRLLVGQLVVNVGERIDHLGSGAGALVAVLAQEPRDQVRHVGMQMGTDSFD